MEAGLHVRLLFLGLCASRHCLASLHRLHSFLCPCLPPCHRLDLSPGPGESPLLHDDAASVVARILEEEWLLPKLQIIVDVHVAEYRMLEFFVLLSMLSFSLLILCSWCVGYALAL